jgi:hypothetical protein
MIIFNVIYFIFALVLLGLTWLAFIVSKRDNDKELVLVSLILVPLAALFLYWALSPLPSHPPVLDQLTPLHKDVWRFFISAVTSSPFPNTPNLPTSLEVSTARGAKKKEITRLRGLFLWLQND